MLTYNILPGSVDVSVVIRIVDSTDGTPETGVVFNTAGIDIQYRRELAASTAITEATLAALTTAHADGGFLHIGNGYYRLDLPDAAVATGVAGCLVHGTVTGMVVIGCYIQLEALVNSNYTRLGAPAGASVSADVAAMKVDTAAILVDTGTTLDGRIPAALVSGRMDASVGAMAANVLTASAINADAITDAKVAADVTIASVTGAVGSVTGAVGSVTGAVGSVTGAVGSVTAGVTLAANAITAAATAADFGAEMAAAIWTDTTAANYTVALSVGKSLMNGVALGTGLTINAYTGNTVQTGDSFARIGAAGAGLTAIDLPNQTMDITGNITGNLSGSVGSVTGAVGSVTGAVGSVTGNIGGNVVGTVAGVTPASGAELATLTTTLNTTRYQKNTGSQKVYFVLVDSTDHVTRKTAITVTATRSLDGAAFGAAAGAVTEVASGVYYLTPSAGDINGDDAVYRFTGAACDPVELHVVTY